MAEVTGDELDAWRLAQDLLDARRLLDDATSQWSIPDELAGWLVLAGVPGLPEPELWLDGIVLTAGDDGKLSDLVVWVVSDRAVSPVRSRPVRLALPGLLSRSTLGQVALAMAALVAWGDWLPGRGRPLSTGADRGTLRRWLRDNDPATLGPVRVLDLRRSAPGEDQRGTHASPTPHLRRGHYRRVAVGEGRAGREWRWIAPTVVGGELADDRTVTVWRLPEP